MPTDDEHREVARRLRELPTDMCEVEKSWELEGIDTNCSDQTDYYLIYQVLLDVLPAEHMHLCDYEDLHNRLADLIDPTDEMCEAELTDTVRTRGIIEVYECSECGKSWEQVWAHDYEFCPYCGRRIEYADE